MNRKWALVPGILLLFCWASPGSAQCFTDEGSLRPDSHAAIMSARIARAIQNPESGSQSTVTPSERIEHPGSWNLPSQPIDGHLRPNECQGALHHPNVSSEKPNQSGREPTDPSEDVRKDPYFCETTANKLGSTHTLSILRHEAALGSASAHTAPDLCVVAELYKRLGDSRAQEFYERAIREDPIEPAYEYFFGSYYRLYRGAGQHPLFPEAEEHLLRGLAKLKALKNQANWDPETSKRITRALISLYERDGFHLARRKSNVSSATVEQPWLFFSPSVTAERSSDDLDQSSDVRDLTAAAFFSENCLPPPVRRLCGPLNTQELAGMVREMTPTEADGTIRIRYGSAPVLDVVTSARRTKDGVIPNYFMPDSFADLKLFDFGVHVEKPFRVADTTDAVIQFSYDHINRRGLIEFQPGAPERIEQYQVYGAVAHYLGPDRINLSYTFVRQEIDPTPYLTRRVRQLEGGTVDYQIFRPLPLAGRDANAGLGKYFETRGIDLLAGVLDDHDSYTGATPSVISRRDYFVGVSAKGLDRFDLTVQPTLFTSSVNNDATQQNSQLRIAGNGLVRILDEERAPGIPSQSILGLPVAFMQVVVPFHWDVPRTGLDVFRSREVGAELWSKLISRHQNGVTTLIVLGYANEWFPGIQKDLNLARLSISIGF